MMKTSEGIHWALATSVTGDGQLAFYVKIFGSLPDAPIKVSYAISALVGNTTFLTTTVDACCATDSHEDVLESGNYLSVHYKHVTKWNGGNELDETGHLKNIKLAVTLGV
jgi:hypothetical protein